MNEREIAAEIADVLAWHRNAKLLERGAEVVHPAARLESATLDSDSISDGKITRYHSTATASIMDLMVEAASEMRQRWRAAVVNTLNQQWGSAKEARVLDYGASVGSDTLYFAEHCRSAFYYDQPGVTSEFAVKRFMRHGTSIARISNPKTYGPDFDAVVSFTVPGRHTDVLAHLDEVVRLTKYGGMLFLSDSLEVTKSDDYARLLEVSTPSTSLDDLMAERCCRLVTVLEGCIRVYVKGPSVSVIVPICNAYDELCQLLGSIKNTTPGYPVRWVLVNDASTDERITPLLNNFVETVDSTCQLVSHERNRGFVQSCNGAMAAAGTDDVILLNSDTILYDGWARRLLEAAYEDAEIGTATPLSNNASCYSMFQNVTPSNHLNAMLVQAEIPSLPIPVGTGFCLYIKREVLDRVGMFDPVFGKGYGEETDLCLRAVAAGYRHVLAPKVFVYHAGSASMVAANVVGKGETTIPAHEQIVAKRYPKFVPSVHEFIGSGIIDATARELNKRYIVHEASYRPTIAIVVHDDPFAQVVGGTTFHIRDLIQELEHDFVFYVITPDANKLRVTGYADGITYFYVPSTPDFTRILEELNPSLIHIHHLLYFPSTFVDALTEWRGQKIFTIHDFYGVCPQYNLVNYRQAYCGVPEPEECDRCARKLFGTGYSTPVRQRRIFQRLVDSVTTVLAPSRSALTVFRKAIVVPEEKVRIIPHPFINPRSDSGIKHLYASLPEESLTSNAADKSAKQLLAMNTLYRLKKAQIRVGFVGYNSSHKGTALLQGIIAACANDPITFVGLGDITLNTKGTKSVVLTGLYEREQAIQLIKQYLIDVVVVTSIWPETFSFVVSEAWKAGVPVVVGPLGAPAERVGETGAGMVVADYRVQSFTTALRQLIVDKDQLKQLKLAAAAVSLRKDYDDYRELYFQHVSSVTPGTRSFTSSVELISHEIVDISQIPAVVWLVGVRKRFFPVGSARERFYFWMHNRISPMYAGGIKR